MINNPQEDKNIVYTPSNVSENHEGDYSEKGSRGYLFFSHLSF